MYGAGQTHMPGRLNYFLLARQEKVIKEMRGDSVGGAQASTNRGMRGASVMWKWLRGRDPLALVYEACAWTTAEACWVTGDVGLAPSSA
jgi:hypothetical protein